MALFDPGNREKSPRHAALYAAYEIAFTFVDFAAAMLLHGTYNLVVSFIEF